MHIILWFIWNVIPETFHCDGFFSLSDAFCQTSCIFFLWGFMMVIKCFFCSLKDLHQKCTKEMDDYVGCMYYHTNEFDLCRKEQQAFEKKCSLEWNYALLLSKIISQAIWSEQMSLFSKNSLIFSVCMTVLESLPFTMFVD